MQFQTPAISYYFDKVYNKEDLSAVKFIQILGIGMH